MSCRHTLSLTRTLSGKVDCYSSDDNTWKGWKYMNTDVRIFYTCCYIRSGLRIRSLSIFDSPLVTSKVRHSAIKKTKPNSSTYKIYYATKKIIHNISHEGRGVYSVEQCVAFHKKAPKFADNYNSVLPLFLLRRWTVRSLFTKRPLSLPRITSRS